SADKARGRRIAVSLALGKRNRRAPVLTGLWRRSAEYHEEPRAFDVAATQDETYGSIVHTPALAEQCGKRRRTRTFRNLMSVIVIGAHRFGDVVLGYRHDARRAPANDADRIGVRRASRN